MCVVPSRIRLGSSSSHTHQQYPCKVLCERAGKILLQLNLSGSNKVLALLHQERRQTHSRMLTGLSKPVGWPSQQDFLRQPQEQHGEVHFQGMGHPIGQPIYNKGHQEVPSVYFPRRTQSRVSNYSLPSELGNGPDVWLSPIPQVILKLKLDQAKLIVPGWPRQCWFSDLLRLSCSTS